MFHMAAESFDDDITGKLTTGMIVLNASQVTETDLYMRSANTIDGTVWLETH